jgi:2,4-diketo-3-deoxy-L-fuconate hydrolase
MKLARIGSPGQERPVVVEGDGEAIDVSAAVDDFDAAFLASGGLVRLRDLLSEKQQSLPRVPLEGVRIGSPLRRPGKVICVGLNYRDHARETGMQLPTEPILFGKANNSVCGPNDAVLLPPGAKQVDWEVELGVVIGSECRYLESEGDAQERIAGYCVVNDVSEREYQLERGGQWIKGKSSETFNPMGPWLVTADRISDPLNLRLELRVNGETMQSGSTRDMVFNPAFLVHYVSQFMVLEPGDLINTGTPLGTGMGFRPPRFLSEGDVMEVSITGLGSQRQQCERTSLPQRVTSQIP